MSRLDTAETRTVGGQPSRGRQRRGFLGTVRAEWIKHFSLRSTWWISVATVVLNIGVCLGLAASLRLFESMVAEGSGAVTIPGENGQPMEELAPGSLGLLSEVVAEGCSMLGQLVFVILAVLIITNEYSSGMIRATMTVVPRRRTVLSAKLLVIAVHAVVVFAVSLAAGWGLSYLLLRDSVGLDLTINSPASWRILGGFIAEMVLIAWLCLGLGAIIRSSAGAIGAAVGLVMVLPMIFQLITGVFAMSGEPTGWRKTLVDVQQFLPTTAGSSVIQSSQTPGSILGPWEGLAVLGGWTALVLVLAYIVISRRDV